MKNVISILFLLIVNSSSGQSFLNYGLYPINVDMAGTSIKLNIERNKRDHSFQAGLGWLINPPEEARFFDHAFSNKAYATSFFQHLMINAGYSKFIRFKNGQLSIYPLIQLQLSYTGQRTEGYGEINDYDTVLISTYKIIQSPPYVYIVFHLGVGCEIPLSKRITINQEVGLTPGIVWYYDSFYKQYFRNAQLGIGTIYYSIGLKLKLPK